MNMIPRLLSSHPVTDDLRATASAGEDLLRHSAEQAGEEFRRARIKFETLLADTKHWLAAAEAASSTGHASCRSRPISMCIRIPGSLSATVPSRRV